MALVDRLLHALPKPPSPAPDPRLLAKAAGPGRVRGIALEVFERARRRPQHAQTTLRRFSREARALHSRERRFVGDGLVALIRHEAVFDALLAPAGERALAHWLGWLVVQGLPAAEAERHHREATGARLPFERCVDPAAELSPALEKLPPREALALVGSLSGPLAAHLARSLGDEGAATFLAASNHRAPVVLRANPARTDRSALARRLLQEGLETRPTPLAPEGLIVCGTANLRALPSFKEGCFDIQDEGSQLVGLLIEPRGLVVDLCAGAGGKTLQVAHATRVVAGDIRTSALRELTRRAERAGVGQHVRTVHMHPHGALPPALAKLRRGADQVLVDAPCTGTGTWRRHPELRWRFTEEALARLQRSQLDLLERAAELVAPGGHLVYATCSVLRAENQDIAHAFEERHADFRRTDAAQRLPPTAQSAVQDGYLAVAPHTHDTDGFFGMVWRRSPSPP